MYKITSKLKLCGDNISNYDMLEKTFTTFLHVSSMVLQRQYQEKSFKKHSEMLSVLLVAKRNNELPMKNHDNQPTRSTPLPEVNEVYFHYAKREKGCGPVCGRGRGHCQGRTFSSINHPPKKNSHQKWKGKDEKPKAKESETRCYRCSEKGHWANIYRTTRHLVVIYQASKKI
ncbi:PREDICTED: uncharacterized protein LOC109206033 [Nicotiana attenuata]|uniref:uncharacterized protein LOC109206033 n=1 Tax=Nicotiana attenuata TaxID=49451 RepID=UPI0009048138|nr:PREDICTED: uncharacterized protein LOC109206033 [Nicotiana attenuata]